MKGIKVIEVGTEPEEVEDITRECFSLSDSLVNNPYMVLEFPDGTQIKQETYYWGWGDYWEFSVDNVIDFSTWLSEEDLFDEDFEALKNGDGQQHYPH